MHEQEGGGRIPGGSPRVQWQPELCWPARSLRLARLRGALEGVLHACWQWVCLCWSDRLLWMGGCGLECRLAFTNAQFPRLHPPHLSRDQAAQVLRDGRRPPGGKASHSPGREVPV